MAKNEIVDPTGAAAVAQPMLVTMEQLQQIVQAAVSASKSGNSASDEAFAFATAALKTASDQVKQSEYFKNGNPNPPQFSVFDYPEGGHVRPKPKFRANWTYTMCGVPLRENQLTPLEIELLNKIDTSTSTRDGSWKITVEKSGTTTKVAISVPARTQDDRSNLPSFAQIVSELLGGKEASDFVSMATKIAEMQRELEALKKPVLVSA